MSFLSQMDYKPKYKIKFIEFLKENTRKKSWRYLLKQIFPNSYINTKKMIWEEKCLYIRLCKNENIWSLNSLLTEWKDKLHIGRSISKSYNKGFA